MNFFFVSPIQFVDQRQMQEGGDGAPLTGDCDAACIASFTGIPLAEIPLFYTTGEPVVVQGAKRTAWLLERGWGSLSYPLAAAHEGGYAFIGTLVHITGKSPRGNFNHGVLGEIVEGGWRLVHDPHPSRAGIVGEPVCFEYMFPLPRLAA